MILKAISIDNNSELWGVLGSIYANQADKEKARQAYLEALRLDQGNTLARQSLDALR